MRIGDRCLWNGYSLYAWSISHVSSQGAVGRDSRSVGRLVQNSAREQNTITRGHVTLSLTGFSRVILLKSWEQRECRRRAESGRLHRDACECRIALPNQWL